MARPSTLSREISPPPRRKFSKTRLFEADASHTNESGEKSVQLTEDAANSTSDPTLAAIEAGDAQIRNHLEYFSRHLAAAIRPASNPRLNIKDFEAWYERSQHQRGRHFVVHQHDHPVSGTHYDLRIQFSESSTLSFAIPYGLPGNANSVRPNRLAIETRVHTLWNNLIETASHSTGSLLIWDTGEYEILPWKEEKSYSTDDELSDGESTDHFAALSQNERLIRSFERRRIRLRLQGSRLPRDYTVSMWLPSSNDRNHRPKEPKRKRRRTEGTLLRKAELLTSSDDEEQNEDDRHAQKRNTAEETTAATASDSEEDAAIRESNAYPGASNTIGSVHQRNWMLTLDKKNSGFRRSRSEPDQGRWIGSWEPFFVLGRDHERSVVTDRDADQVMNDEGVERFIGRKMWRPILE